jgi:hypothetical protein
METRGKISEPFIEMCIGNLPQIVTDDHLTNNVIRHGAKLFLPKDFHQYSYTGKRMAPMADIMEKAGVIYKVTSENKPRNTFPLFLVPKSDPHNPRAIIDFSKVTPLVNSPKFTLPNVHKLFRKVKAGDHMGKLDLTNGFFHIPLCKQAQDLLGLKIGKQYYKFKRLPQGLSHSPYLMQRVMTSILTTLLKSVNVTFFLYLDDILLLGQPSAVTKAIALLRESTLLINLSKSTIVPTRRIEYLGIKNQP